MTEPDQLRLLAVHAHPDDESSKGAATMAKYVAEGARVLVAAEGRLSWFDLNRGWDSALERTGLLGRTLNISLAAEFAS